MLFNLRVLSAGDLIEVDVGGTTFRYVVKRRRVIAASDAPTWSEIWSADVERDSLTIVAMGGDFDFTTRSFVDRVVVRAERIEGDELEMATAIGDSRLRRFLLRAFIDRTMSIALGLDAHPQ